MHGGLCRGPVTEAGKLKNSISMTRLWREDPEFRARQDERRRARFADPQFIYDFRAGQAKYHADRDFAKLLADPHNIQLQDWAAARQKKRAERLAKLKALITAIPPADGSDTGDK
jgi:hypothetical protein